MDFSDSCYNWIISKLIVLPWIDPDTPNPLSQKQAMQEAHDARRKTSLSQIRTEITLYENENGHYPKSLTELKEYSSLIDINDPKTNERFAYATTSGKLKYCLGACLETDDVPLDHNSQCVEKLSLSCGTNTPYAISAE